LLYVCFFYNNPHSDKILLVGGCDGIGGGGGNDNDGNMGSNT
jgi:hypothetical protein